MIYQYYKKAEYKFFVYSNKDKSINSNIYIINVLLKNKETL